MTLQLANLFETPVILDMVPEAERLNLELKQAIEARRASDGGVQKSNWNGWQSDVDMLSWGGDAAEALAERFLRLCENFTAITQPPQFHWSVEMWANVSSCGASNEAHVHPGGLGEGLQCAADVGEGHQRVLDLLEAGAEKARAIASGTLADVRAVMGVGPARRPSLR